MKTIIKKQTTSGLFVEKPINLNNDYCLRSKKKQSNLAALNSFVKNVELNKKNFLNKNQFYFNDKEIYDNESTTDNESITLINRHQFRKKGMSNSSLFVKGLEPLIVNKYVWRKKEWYVVRWVYSDRLHKISREKLGLHWPWLLNELPVKKMFCEEKLEKLWKRKIKEKKLRFKKVRFGKFRHEKKFQFKKILKYIFK